MHVYSVTLMILPCFFKIKYIVSYRIVPPQITYVFANQQPGTILFQSNPTVHNLWDPRLGKLQQDPF